MDNVSAVQSSFLYYRLRSVDIDGESQLSGIRIIKLVKDQNQEQDLKIFPNPVRDEMLITIPESWQNQKVIYEIVSANGHKIKTIENANSSQTERFDVSALPSGMYFVIVINNGKKVQQKFLKL